MPNYFTPNPILGIDLGTRTCQAAYVHEGKGYDVTLGPNKSKSMPSVFLYDPDASSVFVGHEAIEQVDGNEILCAELVLDVKRRMKWDDNPVFYPRSGGREFRPSQIAGAYVRAIKDAAARDFKRRFERDIDFTVCVVTIPADFGKDECDATRRACSLHAGFSEVYFLHEPIAVAYTLPQRAAQETQVILVADMGGGTFDLALMEVGRGIDDRGLGLRELGRGGNAMLGGRDWDSTIAEYVARQTLKEGNSRARREEYRRLIEGPGYGHYKLFKEAEFVKERIFNATTRTRTFARVNVPFAYTKEFESRDTPSETPVDGPTFERLTRILDNRCRNACEELFQNVSKVARRRYEWKDVDAIVLAGGGSKMWTLPDTLKAAWGRGKEVTVLPEPQSAVARGAARHGDMIRTMNVDPLRSLICCPRYPHCVGVRTHNINGTFDKYVEIITRNEELPFKDKKFVFKVVVPDSESNSLEIVVGRKRYTLRGESWEPIETFQLDKVPQSEPGADDLLKLWFSCEEDGQLTVQALFRDRPMDGKIPDPEIPGRSRVDEQFVDLLADPQPRPVGRTVT